ncbi:MAG: undecaprenyl-phosphate glucose phosphotransferase [Parahaliea sp.]
MHPQGFLREHSALLAWIFRLVDVLVLLVPCIAAYLVVFGAKPLSTHYQAAIVISVLLLMIIFQAYSLYRAWRGVSYAQEFTAILLGWTTVFAMLAVLSVITKTSAMFSRAWFLMWYICGAALLLTMRFILRRTLQKLRAKGYNLRHIVIIGAGDIGPRVLNNICSTPETGFKVAGYFDNSPQQAQTVFPHLPELVYGRIREAYLLCQQRRIDQVWLAMPLKEAEHIEAIIGELQLLSVDIRLIPDFFGFRLINHSISTIADMPVLNLSVTPMDGINRWIKLLEDKLISSFILMLISPLLLCIAVLVKASSHGPIFYGQRRLSWNGREFTMYKFRTMPVDAEAQTGAIWANPSDTRATPLGKWLRKTSLDELPQFWNVLKGDMSIVGPRPERPIFVEKFRDEIPNYMQKHMVKGGITGWAQVHGWRGDTDLKKRIEYDLFYIDNWTLWLDLKIIFMTVFKGFTSKNAY